MHMRKSYRRLAEVLLVAVGLGFWFPSSSESHPPIFGLYTSEHLLNAAIATLMVLLGIVGVRYLAGHCPEERGGLRRRVFALLLGVFALAFVSEVGLSTYKQRQVVALADSFHPFLQGVPIKGEAQRHINSWGFRGDEIPLKKSPKTYRIFTLGGSTVYCDRTVFEKTYSRLLEQKLGQHYPQYRLEVQNAGFHWHTSLHSLIKYLSQIERFKPDMVILYHGINDLCRSFNPPSLSHGAVQSDYGHFHGPLSNMFKTYFFPHSHFYVWAGIKSAFSRFWYSTWRSAPLKDVSITNFASLPSFRRNMNNLIQLLKAKGVTVILASQPFLYKEGLSAQEDRSLWLLKYVCHNETTRADLPSMIRGMRAFNTVSREISRANATTFVDLAAQVPKSLKYFRDDVHYTEAGNALIADRLYERVVELKAIERAFSPPTP